MKHWTYLFFATLISCNNQPQKVESDDTHVSVTPADTTPRVILPTMIFVEREH